MRVEERAANSTERQEGRPMPCTADDRSLNTDRIHLRHEAGVALADSW